MWPASVTEKCEGHDEFLIVSVLCLADTAAPNLRIKLYPSGLQRNTQIWEREEERCKERKKRDRYKDKLIHNETSSLSPYVKAPQLSPSTVHSILASTQITFFH